MRKDFNPYQIKISVLSTFIFLFNVLFNFAQNINDIQYDENLNIYRVVAVRNQNEQITSLSNIVTVEKPYAIYAPNAFSPDGDGLNDVFNVSGQGIIDFQKLEYMNDPEIYAQFTKIRGIGVWTVDMFLMSCLKKLDVFSENDAGLVRAISKLYKLPTVCKDDIKFIASKWSPYRSVACWFLWRALDEKRI